MMSTQVGIVYSTMDYDAFRFLDGNREVAQRRRDLLIKSFQECEIMNPIVVNEKMEIIDGQGRYEAKKMLNTPIYYIIVPDIGVKECQQMNRYNAAWNQSEFIKSFADQGNENYKRLMAVQQETGLAYSKIMRMVNKSRNGTVNYNLKNGDFIFSELDANRARMLAAAAAEILDALQFKGRPSDSFYAAINVAMQTEGYSQERMVKNCRLQKGSYAQMSQLEAQLKEFTRIYNYRTNRNKCLYFEDYMRNKGRNARTYDYDHDAFKGGKNVSTLKKED